VARKLDSKIYAINVSNLKVENKQKTSNWLVGSGLTAVL
jgi:hypothetical protein